MKQTTEQELKEKLAQFAGFKKASPVHFDWKWEYPQGASHKDLPDFPHDINACIEYLGPQLDYVELTLSKKDNIAKAEVGYKGDFFEYDGAFSEGLAMAFSRAVEQAIDKGAK